MLNDTEQYFYVRNAQGDIIGIINSIGEQVVSYTYDTWGKLISITGDKSLGEKNPYRYRGYRYDTETGYYYLQSRYYNPEWGRFLNADAIGGSIGELLSHNTFAYCNNNPVTSKDPNGFRPVYTQGEETVAMRDASYKAMNKVSKAQATNKKLYKAKTFYLEGEGPKLNFNKKDLSVKAQLASGEAGLATVYDEYEYGKWALKSPYSSADIGLEISDQPKASLYGKISLFSAEGSIFIPIPFTNAKLEIGVEGDFLSIGGGLVVDSKERKIKAGYHLGVEGDITFGIN